MKHTTAYLIMRFSHRIDMSSVAGIVLFLFVAAFPTASACAARATIKLVALDGQQAPGAEPEVTYNFRSSFDNGPPMLNSAGMIAFRAGLRGTGVVSNINDAGIWMGAPNAIELFIRGGDPAPGIAGSTIRAPRLFGLNVRGQVVFTGFPTGVPQTLWLGDTTAISVIATGGQAAPGSFLDFDLIFFQGGARLNDKGHVAFHATSSVHPLGGRAEGIWRYDSSVLTLVAEELSNAPGTNQFFRGIELSSPSLGSSGSVAFMANIADSNGAAAHDSIWVGSPGALGLVARQGDQVPGLETGVTFLSVFSGTCGQNLNINSLGVTAFGAQVSGPGIDASNDTGIWLGSPESLQLILRKGMAVPGMAADVHFSFVQNAILNDAGDIVFLAGIQGPGVNTDGVWAGKPDSLRLVALKGDQVPGMPEGVVWGQFSFALGRFSINASGEIAFMDDRLEGPGVIPGITNRGIWAENAAKELTLVVAGGDTIAVAPDDTRVINDFTMHFCSNDADGGPQWFNESGELAFKANVRGATGSVTGIFLATIGDCNGNGVDDTEDIAGCVGNPACADCNENGIPDACDTANNDCNTNEVPDECDIAAGVPDINKNGIPDTCELIGDLNGDDIVDLADARIQVDCLSGPELPLGPLDACRSADLNGNGFVDLNDASILISVFDTQR